MFEWRKKPPAIEKQNDRPRSFSRRELLIGAAAAAAGTLAAEAIGLVGGLTQESAEKRPGRFKEMTADVDGATLRFVGVSHDLGTFEHNKEKIRGQIKNAPFVILEYFDKQCRDAAVPDDGGGIKEMTMEAQRFFASVGQICAEESKDVVVVNPESMAAHALHSLLLLGIPLGALYTALIAKEEGNLTNWKKIIGLASTMPSLAVWLTEAGATEALRKELQKNQPLDENKDDQEGDLLGWHFQDWRDVYTAKGIRLARNRYDAEINKNQEMLTYHGLQHAKALGYVANPNQIEAKEYAYALQNVAGELTLRRYHYDPQSKSWSEKDSAKL